MPCVRTLKTLLGKLTVLSTRGYERFHSKGLHSSYFQNIFIKNSAMDHGAEYFQLQKLKTSEVTSCDLNVNYLMAIGSSDKSVRVLEWKTGLGFVDLFYSPIKYHKYAITCVKFSPQGTILASSSLDGTAILINVLDGTKIFTVVQYETSNIKFCDFTFDCTKLITAADNGVLCFWDLARHRQIRHCRLHEADYGLTALAVSPDSEYLFSIDSGNLMKLWFIGCISYNQPYSLLLKKNIHDNVLGCDFSPIKKISGTSPLYFNYYIATCGADGWLKNWTITIERGSNEKANSEYFKCDLILLHVLKDDNDILSVRFNSSGKYLVSTGLDNTIKLWEVHGNHCFKILQGHTKYVTCAAFSKDSKLLITGSIDKTLIIWNLSKNLTLDSVLLSPCNISSHFTHVNVTNYDVKKSETDKTQRYSEYNVLQILTFSSTVSSVQFHDNDVLAVAGRKTAEVWRKQINKLVYEQKETLKGYSINYLDMSHCGSKIIICSTDGTIIFWDLNIGLIYKMKIPSCTACLRTCKFSPDSKFIAAAGDNQTVYLWDAKSLEFIKIMQRHNNTITAIAFTPDSEFLISTCSEGDIMLQNLEQEKYSATTSRAHDLGVNCCDFSSTTISETECTGSHSYNFDRKSDKIYLLATGGNDSLVKLWKVSTSKIWILNILFGHGSTVNYVKFAPNKPFILASCSSDTTIRIWDTKTKHCLQVLSYHQSVMITCSFSKDSTLLATGSLDKKVLILKLTERSCHELTESTSNSKKLLENWTATDVANWFFDIGCPEIADKINARQLNGRKLLNLNNDSITNFLELESENDRKKVRNYFSRLKESLSFFSDNAYKIRNAPHKFLCPITHQIMQDPVICADGYTYDRAAITEWFLNGKLTSPITKKCLTTPKLLPYTALKINIYKFLQQNQN